MKIGTLTADLQVKPDEVKNKQALAKVKKDVEKSLNVKGGSGKVTTKAIGVSTGEAIALGTVAGFKGVSGIIGAIIGSAIVGILNAELNKALDIVKSIGEDQETLSRLKGVGFTGYQAQQLQRWALQNNIQPDKINDLLKDMDQAIAQARTNPQSTFASFYRRTGIDTTQPTTKVIQDTLNFVKTLNEQDRLGFLKMFSGGVESNIANAVLNTDFKTIFKNTKGNFLNDDVLNRAYGNYYKVLIAEQDEKNREIRDLANNPKLINDAIKTKIQLQAEAFDKLTKTTLELNSAMQGFFNDHSLVPTFISDWAKNHKGGFASNFAKRNIDGFNDLLGNGGSN